MGFLSSAISKAKSYASTARSTYRTSRSSGGTRRASASRAVQNVGRSYARGGSRTARRIQRSKTAAAIRRVGSGGKARTRKVPTTKTTRPKVPTGRHLAPSKAVIARETVSERLSKIPTVRKIRGVLEESKKHRPTMVGGLGVSAGGVLVTDAREQPAYKDLTHKKLTKEEKARNLNVTLRQTLQPDVTKTRDYYNVLTEEEAIIGSPSGIGTATVPPSVTGKPDTKKKGGYWQSSQTFGEQVDEIGLLGALGERQKALGATYIPTIGEYQKAVQTTPIVKDVFGAASKVLESKLSPERIQYGRDVSTALYGWGRSHPVTYVAEVGSMVALGPALKGVGYAAKGVKASRTGQFVGKGLGVTGSALGKVPVVGTVGRGLGYAGRGAVAVGKTRIPMTKMTVGGVTAQAALVGVPTYMTAQERKKITSTMDIDAAREQGLVVGQMKPLTEREVQIRKAEFDAAFIGHSAAFASGAALAPAAGSLGRGYASKQKAFREAVGESKPIMYRDTIYSGQPQAPTGSLTSQVAKDIKQSLKESGHKVVDRDVFVPAKTVRDPQPFLGTEGKLVVSDLEKGIYTGKIDIPSIKKMQASTQASKGEAVIESAYEKKLADFYEKKAIGGGRVIRRDAESMTGISQADLAKHQEFLDMPIDARWSMYNKASLTGADKRKLIDVTNPVFVEMGIDPRKIHEGSLVLSEMPFIKWYKLRSGRYPQPGVAGGYARGGSIRKGGEIGLRKELGMQTLATRTYPHEIAHKILPDMESTLLEETKAIAFNREFVEKFDMLYGTRTKVPKMKRVGDKQSDLYVDARELSKKMETLPPIPSEYSTLGIKPTQRYGEQLQQQYADDIAMATQMKGDILFGAQYPKYAKLSKTMRVQQSQKGYEKLIDEAPIKISGVEEYRDIRRIKSEKTAKEAFEEWQDVVAGKKATGRQRHLLKKIDTVGPDTTVYPPFDEAYSRILPEARRQVRLQTTAEMLGERLPKLDTGEAWEIGETARLWKARHSATQKMTASEFISARKQTIDPTELAYISELKRKVPRLERYAAPTEVEVAERVGADITYLTKKKDIIKYRQQQVDELLADSGEAVAERKAIIGERFGVNAPKTGGYVEPESGYWTPAQIKKTKKEMNIIFGEDKPKPKPTAAKTPKGEQQGTGGMFYETPILETAVPKTKIVVKSRTKARETQWSRQQTRVVETPITKPRTRTRMVSPFVAAQTGKQRQKDSPFTLTIPQMQTMGVMEVTQGKQMVRDILTQSGIQKTVTPTAQTTQQKTVTPVIQATTDITIPVTPRRPKVPVTPTTTTTPPPTAVPIPPYIPPPIIPFGLSGGGAAAAAPTPTRKRGTQEFRKNPIASLFGDVAPEKKRKGKKEKKQESFSDMLAGAKMPTMITFGSKKTTKKRKK